VNATPRQTRPERGMTLIEILIATAILAIVMLVLSNILISSNRVHSQTVKSVEAQTDVRQAVETMTSELRQAGADPKNPPMGLTAIVYADSVKVRVRMDYNADGVITNGDTSAGPSEDVTYSYSDTTKAISRDPGTGASVLLPNVTSMRFSYYDASNNPLTAMPLGSADAALVHSIGLSVTAVVHDSLRLTSNTRITLRNR
jgi:prepilin-type N-terminal cleavage/methylation domain-containing protein